VSEWRSGRSTISVSIGAEISRSPSCRLQEPDRSR
jgi:hypothetical protein